MTMKKSGNYLTDLDEFDEHKFVGFCFEKKSGLKGYVAIHRSNSKHPSFGATRYWNYNNELDALKDVLRLSRLMSYKAALAGLPGGGAKAVLIFDNKKSVNKQSLLTEYARRINNLSGRFITGSDVGLENKDVKLMRKISPYFVGTEVSAEKYTALGLFYALNESLKFVYGTSSLASRSFAIQGLGKVGTGFLKFIYHQASKIYVSDTNIDRIKSVKKEFPKVEPVLVNDIDKKKVDIYSPSALSNCINTKNVKKLRCNIILGGANNQLETKNLSRILHKNGILYAPDYIVNAGGLISVYSEYKNTKVSDEHLSKKVKIVGKTLSRVLNESKKTNNPPLIVSNQEAEKIFNNYS